MPWTPTGCIEIFHIEEFDGSGAWNWAVDIVRLIYGNGWDINGETDYDMFGKLFGHPAPVIREYGGSIEHLNPVVPERGMPADCEFLTCLKVENDGGDSTEWHTWVLWSELKSLDLIAIAAQTGKQIHKGWFILSDIMTAFAKWYGDDHVRLIVWWAR